MKDAQFFKQEMENLRHQLSEERAAHEKTTAVARERTAELGEAVRKSSSLEAELRSKDKDHAKELKATQKKGFGEGRQEGWFEGYAKGGLDFLNSRRFTDRVANALLPWIQFGMRIGCRQMVKRVGNAEVLSYAEPDYDDNCDEPAPVMPDYVSPPPSPLRVRLAPSLLRRSPLVFFPS